MTTVATAAVREDELLERGVLDEIGLLKQRARQQLWREGRAAEYLLDEGQRKWVARLSEAPPASWSAWKIARQRGKTFAALTWLLQRMGLERNLPCVYLAQTGGNAEAIVSAFFKEIEDDLPPEWGVCIKDGALLVQAKGSELAFFGTDNKQYRRRRGRKAKVVLLDEAAFYEDLLDVEQVYVPQLQTTGGLGLYLSSPPISPAHPFNARCRAAQAAGRYFHDTFWSNPRINHEAVIAGEMERLGLTREELFLSTAWRREFQAEDVTEESRAALPAWNEAVEKELVRDWPVPEFYDGYEAHDAGVTGDPHASLFAQYNPADTCLYIVDELELRSAVTTVRAWADLVKLRETALYGTKSWDGLLFGASEWARLYGELPEYLQKSIDGRAPRQPFMRVGDPAQNICRDLSVDHGLAVFPTAKHEKALMVDNVNQLIVERRLRIHTRCVRLREQLFTTIWDTQRRRWERTSRDHGDLIDDLIYIVRNVIWNRDCRPPPPSQWEQAKKATSYELATGFKRRLG
ncbi:MAG: hypothetical protein Q8K32_11080 [Archangium sp.]|nr:hypothetical protein [Archangium sp.]